MIDVLEGYEIIQIIPIEGRDAVYAEDDGSETVSPIICLALAEHEDGGRRIFSMDMDDEGSFDCPENMGNFVRYQISK